MTKTTHIINIDLLGQVVVDFELARRHNVYTFNPASTFTVTNDTNGIKLKL